MDQGKLEKLRARYAGAGGGDIHDPRFAKVAADQFKGDRRKWPFADVATFMGAPDRPDAPIGIRDLRLDCSEHEAAEPAIQFTNWASFEAAVRSGPP